MKALFISTRTGYSLADLIYHGWINKFGKESVVDYPYVERWHKPVYFDKQRLRMTPYLPSEDDGVKPVGLKEVQEMKDGFEAVFFFSLRHDVKDLVAEILAWGWNVPTVFVDNEDTPYYPKYVAPVYEIVDKVNLYLKREYMPQHHQHPKVKPCSACIIETPDVKVDYDYRPIDALWCGISSTDVRRELCDELEKIPNHYINKCLSIDQILPPDEYRGHLLLTKIGLSARGHGYDCMKNYEIPYYGGVLLIQEPQLSIPDFYTHWENAVIFKSTGEIPALIKDILRDDNRRKDIAKKGRQLVLEKHTSIKRVEYILEYLKFL